MKKERTLEEKLESRTWFMSVMFWLDLILENVILPIKFIWNLVHHRGSKRGNTILGLLTLKALVWVPFMLVTQPDTFKGMLRCDTETWSKVYDDLEDAGIFIASLILE